MKDRRYDRLTVKDVALAREREERRKQKEEAYLKKCKKEEQKGCLLCDQWGETPF